MNNPENDNRSEPRTLSATRVSPLPFARITTPLFDSVRFVSPHDRPRRSRNRLPHREVEGCPIFLTFRLADSIPDEVFAPLAAERYRWLERHPEPWCFEDEVEYHKLFSQRIFDWLDEGHGSCVLRDPAVRAHVQTVLTNFENERQRTFCFVIMPNHIHTLFLPQGASTIAKLVRAWKGVSSREILRNSDEETLWQKDYFDRLVRDEDHFWRIARYIRNNPGKARLSESEYTLCEHPEVTKRLNGSGGTPAADSSTNARNVQNEQIR